MKYIKYITALSLALLLSNVMVVNAEKPTGNLNPDWGNVEYGDDYIDNLTAQKKDKEKETKIKTDIQNTEGHTNVLNNEINQYDKNAGTDTGANTGVGAGNNTNSAYENNHTNTVYGIDNADTGTGGTGDWNAGSGNGNWETGGAGEWSEYDTDRPNSSGVENALNRQKDYESELRIKKDLENQTRIEADNRRKAVEAQKEAERMREAQAMNRQVNNVPADMQKYLIKKGESAYGEDYYDSYGIARDGSGEYSTDSIKDLYAQGESNYNDTNIYTPKFGKSADTSMMGNVMIFDGSTLTQNTYDTSLMHVYDETGAPTKVSGQAAYAAQPLKIRIIKPEVKPEVEFTHWWIVAAFALIASMYSVAIVVGKSINKDIVKENRIKMILSMKPEKNKTTDLEQYKLNI